MRFHGSLVLQIIQNYLLTQFRFANTMCSFNHNQLGIFVQPQGCSVQPLLVKNSESFVQIRKRSWFVSGLFQSFTDDRSNWNKMWTLCQNMHAVVSFLKMNICHWSSEISNLPPKVFPQRKDLNKTAAIFGRNLEFFKRFKRISTVVLFLLQKWLNISKGPRSRLDLQDIFL